LYRLYNKDAFVSKPEKVIIEDTNSAFNFFKAVCEKEKLNPVYLHDKNEKQIVDSINEAAGRKLFN
jgi:hypothetical protein